MRLLAAIAALMALTTAGLAGASGVGSPESSGCQLRSVPLAGGPVKTLTASEDCIRYVAVSPDGRRLAYVRGSTAESDLVVAREDGSEATTLATRRVEVGQSVHPTQWRPWSPSGRLLAYTQPYCWRGACDRERVRVVDLSRRSRGTIARAGGSASQPAWSPDGLLTFVTSIELEPKSWVYDAIFLARPDGSRRRAILPARNALAPAWLSRSTLVYQRNLDAPTIYRIGRDGRRQRRLAHGGYWLTVAPGGRWIAYTDYDPYTTNYDVRVMRADGTRNRRVSLPRNAVVLGYAWSRDGRRLAVATRTGGEPAEPMDLRISSPDGRRVRLLRRLPYQVFLNPTPLAWSANGKHLYVTA